MPDNIFKYGNYQNFNSLFFFLVIVILSFVMIGCKKKDPPFYKIREENKSFGYFKKGSYWIYFDPAQNTIDSIFVDTSKYSVREEISDIKKGTISAKKEIITTKCRNNSGSRDLYFDLDGYFGFLQIAEEDSNEKLSWSIFYFNTPDVVDLVARNLKVENISIITISNHNFNNVIYQKSIVSTNDSHTWPSSQTIDTVEYWIAKNVGIIKKIVKNNYYKEEWYLIRSKVLQ
jgi:hypothetical protein